MQVQNGNVATTFECDEPYEKVLAERDELREKVARLEAMHRAAARCLATFDG